MAKSVQPRVQAMVLCDAIRLRNCEFPAPGVYYVQIYCEEKLIAERPLFLQKEE